FSSRRRHTRFSRDWSSDVCSSDLSVKFVFDGYTILPAVQHKLASLAGSLIDDRQFRSFETPSTGAERPSRRLCHCQRAFTSSVAAGKERISIVSLPELAQNTLPGMKEIEEGDQYVK